MAERFDQIPGLLRTSKATNSGTPEAEAAMGNLLSYDCLTGASTGEPLKSPTIRVVGGGQMVKFTWSNP